jgi:hypothetical protein
MDTTVRVTSELLWRATFLAALVDAPLVILIGWRVTSELFRKLKWRLAVAAFVLFATLWGTVASVIYWEAVYQYVFPAWSRWLLPLGYGLLFGGVAVAFWRVSVALRRWQAVWFCLLGGLVSLAGHAIGISRGLLRVPMLAEASPVSALVFGVFEFVFYWCVIVGLAVARPIAPAHREFHRRRAYRSENGRPCRPAR